VQSNLRLSDKEIASDLIPGGKADMILSVEPMESLRYLPVLSPDGWLITNTRIYNNISNYPDEKKLMDEINKLPHHIALDADKMAKDLGSPRSMNIVMLGAASCFLDIEYKRFENAVTNIFKRKGEDIINKNLMALKAGKDFAENAINI
jgi:indolepyruvate ferredoxin oxidoreductase beta subunit